MATNETHFSKKANTCHNLTNKCHLAESKNRAIAVNSPKTGAMTTKAQDQSDRVVSDHIAKSRAKAVKWPVTENIRAIPPEANQCWILEFAWVLLGIGKPHRALAVIDDGTRECLGVIIDTSISGVRTAQYLEEIVARISRPLVVVSHNDKQLMSRAMLLWAELNGIELHFSPRRTPTQKAQIERFKARLQDACGGDRRRSSLLVVQQILERWRSEYNVSLAKTQRPPREDQSQISANSSSRT